MENNTENNVASIIEENNTGNNMNNTDNQIEKIEKQIKIIEEGNINE